MNTRLLLATLTVAMVCTGTAVFSVAQNSSSNPEHEIRDLLTQRCDVLRERADTIEAAFKGGTADADAVITARNDLLHAELKLATDPVERVALCESNVANMNRIEELARVRFNNGTAYKQDVLAATAARLSAEIELLHERKR